MKKHGKLVVSVLVAVLVFMISGCATIITGSDQKVNISSEPSGASVKVLDQNGAIVGNSQTPYVAVLKKGEGFFKAATYRIQIEKAGYKTQEVVLSGSLNAGWYLLGNFFIGGLIGWLIVDPITGAMWTLSPEKVQANLATQSSYLQQGDSLTVVLLQDVPAALASQMQPVQASD